MKKNLLLAMFALTAISAKSQINTYTEGFDSSTNTPNGWSFDTGQLNIRANANARSPQNVVYYGQINAPKTFKYASPLTADGTDVVMSYWINVFKENVNVNKDFDFIVSYSTNDVNYTVLSNTKYNGVTNGWEEKSIIIPGANVPAGSHLYIKFAAVGQGSGSATSMMLDDITVLQSHLAVQNIKKNNKIIVNSIFSDQITLIDNDTKSAAFYDYAGRIVKSIAVSGNKMMTGDLKPGNYIIVLERKDNSKVTTTAIKK